MSEFMQRQNKIEKRVVSGYKAIENSVVSGYKKIENCAVAGYKKIENKLVDTFLNDASSNEQTDTKGEKS